MKPGVSIVICCHNSSTRLPETLMNLSAQKFSKEIPWEVIVVDNASDDNTADVAIKCWPTDIKVPLRVITEPKTGLANARFKSYGEAEFDYISFVDDDNWVNSRWVETVFDFFENHPEATAVGGQSVAVYEKEPPEWFKRISSYYAIGQISKTSVEITNTAGTLLWGAGLCLRREAGLQLLQKGFKILLCGGDEFSISTGEDSELCFALRAAGGRLFYDQRLILRHFMPAERLTWPKALKMMNTMGKASPIIDLYLMALNQPPFDNRPAFKQTWIFQYCKAVWALLRLTARKPSILIRCSEGSEEVLAYEKTRGILNTLDFLYGRYSLLKKRIQHSEWNLASKKTFFGYDNPPYF